MEIVRPAAAGTLESSDVQIAIEPEDTGIILDLQSCVIHQYGRHIEMIIREVLARFGVKRCRITVVDKGALDCTIKARLECALYRASEGGQEDFWEVLYDD